MTASRPHLQSGQHLPPLSRLQQFYPTKAPGSAQSYHRNPAGARGGRGGPSGSLDMGARFNQSPGNSDILGPYTEETTADDVQISSSSRHVVVKIESFHFRLVISESNQEKKAQDKSSTQKTRAWTIRSLSHPLQLTSTVTLPDSSLLYPVQRIPGPLFLPFETRTFFLRRRTLHSSLSYLNVSRPTLAKLYKLSFIS